MTVFCFFPGFYNKDQSLCPCWSLSKSYSVYSTYMSIRTEPWSTGRRWPGLKKEWLFGQWSAGKHWVLSVMWIHMVTTVCVEKFVTKRSWRRFPKSKQASVTCVMDLHVNILVPDTTAHFRRSYGVHALMTQSCFGDTKGTYTISSRWL